MRPIKTYAAAIAAVSALGMTAACGSDDTGTAGTEAKTSESPSMSDTPKDSSTMDPTADLVGKGCADYAKAVPVAVAAGNNPVLTTLVAAVSGKLNPKVNLVDTLNGDEFTVFAPVDDAFAKVPAKTVNALKKDPALLSKVLTYHVVPGQILPADIAGTQTTVEGGTVKVTGSGDNLKVNGANVICGGVHTANATVYLIDSVLMPKM